VRADEVRAAAFRPALGGYRFIDVDQLLDIVAERIDAEISPSSALATARLRRSFRGYDVTEVNLLLDQVRLLTADWSTPPRTSTPTSAVTEDPHDRDIPFQQEPVIASAAAPSAVTLSSVGAAVEGLLRDRGASVSRPHAQRIGAYLLTPSGRQGDRTVEVRSRGPGRQLSIVLTSRDVCDAVERARHGGETPAALRGGGVLTSRPV
jgi:DivIVA domain-containing protein